MGSDFTSWKEISLFPFLKSHTCMGMSYIAIDETYLLIKNPAACSLKYPAETCDGTKDARKDMSLREH